MVLHGIFAAGPVAAHDFWLEPSTYRGEPGRPLTLSFREGHGEGEPLPRNARRLVRFTLHGPGGSADVPGVDGVHPAGLLPSLEEGLYVAGYLNTPAPHHLPAGRFEAYLRAEGLERIAALRARRDESEAPGRERFYRCAKTLFAVGRGGGESFTRRLGLPLELVPEADPYRLAPGGTLPVRLWFRGEPLAGARVVARPRDGAGEPASARTDARGRAVFPLAQAGRWVVKAVHMAEAPPEAEVDWESWWASLTFQVPPPAGGAGKRAQVSLSNP